MKTFLISFLFVLAFCKNGASQDLTFSEIISLSECKDSTEFSKFMHNKSFTFIKTIKEATQKTYLYISDKKEKDINGIDITPATISFSAYKSDSSKSVSIVIKTVIISQLHKLVGELYKNGFESYISKKGKFGVEGVYYQSKEHLDLDIMVGSYSDIYNQNDPSKFYYIELIKLDNSTKK